MPMMSRDVIGMIWGGGVCHTGWAVMESYQFEIFDQYFSVIVTIPHISIKTESLCIPTYFLSLFEASRSDYNAQNT